jgi:hypothetical protein
MLIDAPYGADTQRAGRTVLCESWLTVGCVPRAVVVQDKGQDLAVCEQLPVELELGHEFVFHSIFACPVSRDQSSAENPPTMLPCGHVLCKQSVTKLAKGSTRSFKCPYCPMVTVSSHPLVHSLIAEESLRG